MKLETLPNGRVQLQCASKLDSGAQMLATAELAPVSGGKLRPLRQQSESRTPDGSSMGVLQIDHVAQRARCLRPNGDMTELALESGDRLMNVPMNLFFLPLVRGETDRMEFQILLCRPDAKIYEFEAWVEPTQKGAIEVRYSPNLGLVSFIASAMVPRLAFWFDRQAPHTWAAHRVPMYNGGPEVTMVREGLPSVSLGP